MSSSVARDPETGGVEGKEDVEEDDVAEVVDELEEERQGLDGHDGEGPEDAEEADEVRDEKRWRFVGTVLDGIWEIGEPLRDQGGMGYLFRARHLRMPDKAYVVKLLPPELGGAGVTERRRLSREARITARLSDESDGIVVAVHDMNVDDDLPYFVMPELRGMTLRRRLELHGALPCEEAMVLLTEMVRGVAVAHRHDVVHRDLKPENVFLEKKGGKLRPRIIDFGIAKDLESLTQTVPDARGAPGTIRYMAPECLRGIPAAPHKGIDVWSLGLLGCEMLLGHHPWNHLLQQQLLALYEAGTPLPLLHDTEEGRRLGIPASVSKTLGRALEFDPSRRYTDAGEMLRALQQAQVFDPKELVGRKLKGRYLLEERLGLGGMGVVYRAVDEHRGGGRKTAVKLVAPPAGVADENLERLFDRFDQECEALMKAGDHPHVAKFLDKDRIEKHPYCVMEYVEGVTLAKYLGELGANEAWSGLVRVLEQVAHALDFVHRAGVIHRDVKPANVIVTSDGMAKLVDFGIARVGESYQTEAGTVLGTPGYSAPEQVAGKPGPASDQWALAAIVYRALTGVAPVVDDVATQMDERNRVGRLLDQVDRRRDLPRRLVSAVMRGLASDPSKRFVSCTDFVQEIVRASRGRQVMMAVNDSAETPLERPRSQDESPRAKSHSRRRQVFVLAAALGGSLAAATGVWLWRSTELAAVDDLKSVEAAKPASRAPALAVGGAETTKKEPWSRPPSDRPNATPTSPPQVEVSVRAFDGRREAAGVELRVDEAEVVTPAVLKRAPNAVLRVEVVDRRFARTGTRCVAGNDCRVELRRRRRATSPSSERPEVVKPGDEEDLIRFVCRVDRDCPAGRKCVSNGCVKTGSPPAQP